MTGQPPSHWLVGGGQMGELIRQKDWSSTPLGPIEGWPADLRTAVQICLYHGLPTWIGWGPDAIQFYNDAAIAIVGKKHPRPLGEPTAPWWGEIWPVIGPMYRSAFERGEAAYAEDLRLDIARFGAVEE